jgi:hypothetical protein
LLLIVIPPLVTEFHSLEAALLKPSLYLTLSSLLPKLRTRNMIGISLSLHQVDLSIRMNSSNSTLVSSLLLFLTILLVVLLDVLSWIPTEDLHSNGNISIFLV